MHLYQCLSCTLWILDLCSRSVTVGWLAGWPLRHCITNTFLISMNRLRILNRFLTPFMSRWSPMGMSRLIECHLGPLSRFSKPTGEALTGSKCMWATHARAVWGMQISREAPIFVWYVVPSTSPLRVPHHGHTNSRGAWGVAASGGNRWRVRRPTRWRSDVEALWCVGSHGGCVVNLLDGSGVASERAS